MPQATAVKSAETGAFGRRAARRRHNMRVPGPRRLRERDADLARAADYTRGSAFAAAGVTETLMDRTFSLAVSGAVITVVLLVLFYGPVITAFVVAGSSFVLMIGMIAHSGVHAFGHWWRSHSWLLRRTKTH